MTPKRNGLANGSNGRNRSGHGATVIHCAIYTRKSTDEGLDRDFNSLDAQREAAEAYVQSQAGNGWIVIPDRYDDGGFSGGTLERPALKRLLTDIEACKVQRIVVYKIDRLSRSLLDFARLAEIFEQHGVGIVSVTQQLDTSTSMGRLTMNMLLSFAQFEREMVSDRTRDKLRAARRKGKFVGGGLILGFDRHPDGGRLVVNKAEAERVCAIFRMFLVDPSIIRTVEELNRRGWTLKRWTTKDGHIYGGGKFDKYNVKRLLTNAAYIGKVAFEGNLLDGEQNAIVDEETWERVQELLAAGNGPPQRRSTKNPSLLAGILRCTPCDSAMTPTYSQAHGRRYRYYLCLRAHRQGWSSCPSKSVPAVEVEKFVVDKIRAIGRDPDLVEATVEEARRQLAARKADLEAEIRRVQTDLERAHGDLRGQIKGVKNGGPRHGARTAASEENIPALEAQLAALQDELAGLKDLRIDAGDLRAALAAFDPVWEHLTSAERARIVQLLIERIDYDGGTGKLTIAFSPAGVRTLATDGVVPQEATS